MSDIENDDIFIETEKSEDTENHKGGNPKAIVLLLRILITGTAGWKELRRARLTPEQSASGCLYPLAALASVCKFAEWFYLPEFDLSATLIRAASVFVSFFFSYFAVLVLCRWLFPLQAKDKTDTGYFKQLIQYSLASLALFSIPGEILPIITPITVFLPIWTAFIITKGLRFLRLPEQYQNRCMVTIIVVTIVMPSLFYWLSEQIF